ncbi:alpha/beta fold hydrolase [Pedobacter cryoconitis]|uniref:Pimeloyl-ACP methyl ester carboxylesterase n=1 Tax=Pedobacter cryoconitis TaxID=188932 RepID=A0A327TB82_9SPHI|nr:alpha/beta hydrolase [Pedobacter cryoconitis]RAJ36953.1 pimeloyl-ACP methyl ester carboxylesterase [Pedobacter cryoconitis]
MRIKDLIICAACVLTLLISACQSQVINYGNNQKTGKYFNIRGFKMYYEIYGTGKPLLMIHGNGGDISSFAGNIPYFSKKYQVIVADSRAHGKSEDLRDSLSFEMMADDYAALLDSINVKSAYVVGWSDGGINALLLAIRHPDKVIKLAATGANLWPDSTALKPEFWKSEQETFLSGKDKAFATAKEKNDWKVFLLDWNQPNIPLTALKQVKCPALIIGGDHDLINTEHTVLIAKNIPEGQLWIVPKSGHATLIEHKDEFNHKVDEFFLTPGPQ